MITELGRDRIGLVLAGGAARGAYEVGVIQWLIEEVARDIGREVPLDILCGTSVGAINACALAAFADEPRTRARRLIQRWSQLEIDHVINPQLFDLMLRTARVLLQRPSLLPGSSGLLDPAGLQRIVSESIPFERIPAQIEAGRLSALTVSTTHVSTGRTVVFVQREGNQLPRWSSDPTVLGRATELKPEHALASAALPFLFPPVRIGHELHCDGGLRQNVPLSPARRLGADAIIVVSPRHLPLPKPEAEKEAGGPLAILGQTLNAFMLDRVDSDLDRLRRINSILDAGTRRYGAEFVDEINRELGYGERIRVRPLRSLLIRSSLDLGALAGEYARSRTFAERASSVVSRLLRRLSSAEGEAHSDLLSYVLFDGEYARQLIALGRADARARHEDLCAFFADGA